MPGTGGEVPPATAPALTSISFTADETSVVCASGLVPAGVTADPGWRALAVAGPMDLDLTGVLASLTQPLADAGLALFAVSTYDTDYLLVRASALETAITDSAQPPATTWAEARGPAPPGPTPRGAPARLTPSA